MKQYTINDLTNIIDGNYEVKGNLKGKYVANVKPIDEADEFSLVWFKESKKNSIQKLYDTKSRVIIVENSINLEVDLLKKKCFIVVNNPRLIFLRIVGECFYKKPEFGIHKSAIIDPRAKIHKDVYIGPFTYVGSSIIEKGAIIWGSSYIYDNVKIGKNVIIHAGTVIGSDGFGYSRNENKQFEKFPHIGGVVIEDDVEIGANTCIDKGTLGDTYIKKGAKIDNLTHIAHNVIVGEHSAVIANTMVGGSTKIGNYSWIAPSVSLREGLRIGDNVTVGLGSVVTKNVPDGETWAGSPARPLDEFLDIINKLKKL